MKKAMFVIMAILMTLLFSGCQEVSLPELPEEKACYKIALYIDKFVADDDMAYPMANNPDFFEEHVIVKHIPDKPATSSKLALDTYMQTIVDEATKFLEENPQVKVFVVNETSPRNSVIFDKITELRPDVLCIAILSDFYTNKDYSLAEKVDIAFSPDDVLRSKRAVEQAKVLGAENFVCYEPIWDSDHEDYENYMAEIKKNPVIKEIYNVLETTCKTEGLNYYIYQSKARITITSDTDIPWLIEKYGINTNIFSIASFASSLIISAICDERQGLYAGFPRAGYLGMMLHSLPSINESFYHDLNLIAKEVKEYFSEQDFTGHFSTWKVPFSSAATMAALEYAVGYCEGKYTSKSNIEDMTECFQRALESFDCGDTGFELNLHPDYDNCFLFMEDYIIL